MRIMDLLTPIGKGQRGLIVCPTPQPGKPCFCKISPTALRRIIKTLYLIVLLIDERPEEVTDMQRSVKGRGDQLHF